jgi:hypothetical protein
MLSLQVIPLLLGLVVSLMLATILWSYLRERKRPASFDLHSDLLLWLLVLSGFVLGVFVTYVLFKF